MSKETETIYTVVLYDENEEVIEQHDYFSLIDASKQMEEIESAEHLYPGVTTELVYN